MRKNDIHPHEPMRAPLLMGYSDSYVRMTKDRAIFLSEGVSDKVAAELSALLFYFDSQDQETEINLYIHTNGGASSGMANICDVMKIIHAPIKTILLGKCYSAGAWILSSGTKGKRFALRSAKVMIHGTQFLFPIPGHDFTNSKNYHEFVNKSNDAMLKILAKNTGQPFEKVKADCQTEKWLSAHEAVSYGLIDHII